MTVISIKLCVLAYRSRDQYVKHRVLPGLKIRYATIGHGLYRLCAMKGAEMSIPDDGDPHDHASTDRPALQEAETLPSCRRARRGMDSPARSGGRVCVPFCLDRLSSAVGLGVCPFFRVSRTWPTTDRRSLLALGHGAAVDPCGHRAIFHQWWLPSAGRSEVASTYGR